MTEKRLRKLRQVEWKSKEASVLGRALERMGFSRPELAQARKRLPTLNVARLGPGETLIEEGAEAGVSYVTCSGTLAVFKRREDGTEAKVAEVGPGAVQGEIAVLTGLPRFASVRATGSAEVVVLTPEEFRALMTLCPAFRKTVDELVGERLAELAKH